MEGKEDDESPREKMIRTAVGENHSLGALRSQEVLLSHVHFIQGLDARQERPHRLIETLIVGVVVFLHPFT